MRIGALEAGGTKMVCAIGNENGEIVKREVFPTTTPEETMPKMIAFFKDEEIEALGIGCFGPISPARDSADYGYITSTPKLAWQNYNIVGEFEKALQCPVGFDTDVNAAALGEATYGITKGLKNSIYITIGTGIGVGVLAEGKLLHGMMHPEAGHILLHRHPADTYEGWCPFHKDCLEGLAAGPALEKRWGAKGDTLTDRAEVWEMESYYIAQACVNYCMILSPERIVLGGGVMKQQALLPLVREKFTELLAGYIRTKEVTDVENYIVGASLNDNQGVMGCIGLALQAMRENG
ncbi:MAG: ROK family protein [Lachnospiraceae bacterium]|nr:ROK family protein [Lachnospiraceae bacterium]